MVGPGFVGFEPAAARVADTDGSRDLLAAARALAGVAVKGLSDDECLGVADDVELARRSLDAFNAAVLAEIDARGLCDLRYGTATATWFERRHGRGRVSVAREIRAGKKLRSDLGVLHAAAMRGEITFERVAFIASKSNARNLDSLAAAQDALLALSVAEPSWTAFCALVSDLARYADADGGHDPDADTSRVRVSKVGDDVVIDGVFVGVDGATFEQLVEAATDRLWRQHRRDQQSCPDLPVPTRVELRALALLELVRRGSATDPGTSATTVTELGLVIDADHIDELDPRLADILNTGRPARELGQPGVGDLIGVPVADGTTLWFTPGQWQLLVCNAHISDTILDRLGMPIAVRERLRHPDRAMRRALETRDGGCIFPGCDAPPGWCDAHHVTHYAHDGRTVATNLALLCRHHHGVIHRTGWHMALTDPTVPTDGTEAGSGFFTITTPDGLRLRSRHRPRPHPRQPHPRQPDPAR